MGNKQSLGDQRKINGKQKANTALAKTEQFSSIQLHLKLLTLLTIGAKNTNRVKKKIKVIEPFGDCQHISHFSSSPSKGPKEDLGVYWKSSNAVTKNTLAV